MFVLIIFLTLGFVKERDGELTSFASIRGRGYYTIRDSLSIYQFGMKDAVRTESKVKSVVVSELGTELGIIIEENDGNYKLFSTDPFGHEIKSVRLIYSCRDGYHLYCTGGGGFPIITNLKESFTIIRPRGTGMILLYTSGGDLQLIRDGGDFRNYAIANKRSTNSMNDNDVYLSRDNNITDSSWVIPRSTFSMWNDISQSEGQFFTKQICEDSQRRSLFLSHIPTSSFDNTTTETYIECSVSSDFTWKLQGTDCISSTSGLTTYGFKLGVHLGFGTQDPSTCSSSIETGKVLLYTVLVDQSGHLSDPEDNFFILLNGMLIFKSSSSEYGAELFTYSTTPGHEEYRYVNAAMTAEMGLILSSDCMENSLSGNDMYYTRGIHIPGDDFVIEMEVMCPPGLLGATILSSALWNIIAEVPGIGLSVTADSYDEDYNPCSVFVYVTPPTDSTNAVNVTIDADVGHCSSDYDFYTSIVEEGVLFISRSTSWSSSIRIKCFRTGCGLSTAIPKSETWIPIKWTCNQQSCSLFQSGILKGVVTNNSLIRNAVMSDSDIYTYGGMETFPGRKPGNLFSGGIRRLKINSQCVLRDTSVGIHSCTEVPSLSGSDNITAAALHAVDGSYQTISLSDSVGNSYIQVSQNTPFFIKRITWGCKPNYCPKTMQLWYQIIDTNGVAVGWELLQNSFFESSNDAYIQDKVFFDVRKSTSYRVVFLSGYDNSTISFDAVDFTLECSNSSHSRRSKVLNDIAPGPDSSNPLSAAVLRNSLMLFLAAVDSVTYFVYSYESGIGVQLLSSEFPERFHASIFPGTPRNTVLKSLGIVVWLVRNGFLISDGHSVRKYLHVSLGHFPSSDSTESLTVHKDSRSVGVILYYCTSVSVLRKQSPTSSSLGDIKRQFVTTSLCSLEVRSMGDVIVSATPFPSHSNYGNAFLRSIYDGSSYVISASEVNMRTGSSVQLFYHSRADQFLIPFWKLGSSGCVNPIGDILIEGNSTSQSDLSDGYLGISTLGNSTLLQFTKIPIKTTSSLTLQLTAVPQMLSSQSEIDNCYVVLSVVVFEINSNPSVESFTADLFKDESLLILESQNYTINSNILTADVTSLFTSSVRNRLQSGDVFFSISLPSDACPSRDSDQPYSIYFYPREDPVSLRRPQLCVSGNTVSMYKKKINSENFIKLPKISTTETKAIWWYASCGGVGIRFMLQSNTARQLSCGLVDPPTITDSGYHQSPLLNVQLLYGHVNLTIAGGPSKLPNFIDVHDGFITLSNPLHHGNDFMFSTYPSSRSCGGRSPTQDDIIDFSVESSDLKLSSQSVFSTQLCGSQCVKSGGRCVGFQCSCKSGKGNMILSSESASSNKCECASRYYGQRCDVYCYHKITCSNQGSCSPQGSCLCDPGYGGLNCELTISCEDVSKMFPLADINCQRFSNPLNAITEDDNKIDRCTACLSEGYELLNGEKRFYCKQ